MNTDEQCVKILYENTGMFSYTFNIIEASVIDAVPGFTSCHTAGSSHIFDYILKGKGTIRCGGNLTHIHAGCVCIINSDITATLHTDNRNPLYILRIAASGSFIDNLIKACGIESISISAANEEFTFREIHKMLANTQYSCNPENQKEISQYLFSIMTDAKKENLFKETTEPATTAAKIKNFIEFNIYTGLSLEHITKKFGITKMHVIRLYKKDYGITPMQYIINRKTDIAKNLLTDTTVAIKNISEILNYSNTQHFSNSFKKYTGYSPKQYRSMNSAATK